jgi:hypothetical protein
MMNEHHDTIGGKLGSDQSIENELRVHLKATCTSLAKDVNFVVTCKLTKFVFGNESKQGYKETSSVT